MDIITKIKRLRKHINIYQSKNLLNSMSYVLKIKITMYQIELINQLKDLLAKK